ncbi:MAG: radical SAM protein [Acidobacteriota bacterium]|nr:radical SAM protein [Acidobacteriota bacterium]
MSRKKHLLLLNPWIYDFTAFDFWLRPLGLLYLAAILRDHTRFEIDYLDCLDCSQLEAGYKFKTMKKADGRGSYYKEQVPKPEILRQVPRRYSRYGLPISQVKTALDLLPPPEAVLITCTMTYWYPGVQTAVELIRKEFGQVPIILGGIYASLCREHALGQSGANVVVSGPGENQILKVLEEVCGQGHLKSDSNSVYFSSFDSLPVPAYDLCHDASVISLMTSRGCPLKCTYCASQLLNPGFEQRSPHKIVSEIIHFSRNLSTKQIAFYDDALLINKQHHLEKILESLITNSLNLGFHTPNGLHTKELDLKLARLMREVGFSSIFLSLESSDPDLLRKTGQKVSPSDLEKALFCLEEAGYDRSEISVYLLLGHPFQTKNQVLESLRFVKRLGAKARLAYYSPVPGTEDWKHLVNSGRLSPDSDPLLHNKLIFPYFWSQIGPEDLEEIKRQARSC